MKRIVYTLLFVGLSAVYSYNILGGATSNNALSLCKEEWFKQDIELLNSDKWQKTWSSWIHGDKNPILTLTTNTSKYPFYRYDLTFESVPMEFIYRIEGPDYAKEVKNWIPQTIEGFSVNCSSSSMGTKSMFCPQYISFSFWPSPFSDRDVCQIVCPGWYNDKIHLSVRTVPFEHCSGSVNSSLIHMDEFVAKFIWEENGKVHLTYLGMENPKHHFPSWFMRLAYPLAYKSHVHNYIQYVNTRVTSK